MCLLCGDINDNIKNRYYVDLYKCDNLVEISGIDEVYELKLFRLPNLFTLPITLKNIVHLMICEVPNITHLSPMYNLEVLKLMMVKISKLPSEYVNLKSLYIQDTRISYIPKEYVNLESLEINNSPVLKLNYYPKLKKLLTFRSQINYIPEQYGKTLEELNISLSKNYPKEIHIDILPPYLTNLKTLYASLSIISEIPETYTNLKTLIIHQSCVSELSPKLSGIEILDCSESPISLIPKEFINLYELTYSHERTTWDDSWYKTQEEVLLLEPIQKRFKLKMFCRNIKKNRLEILEDYKDYYKNKKAIIISKTFKKYINYLKHLKQLKNINMSDYKDYYKYRISKILLIQKNFKKCMIYKRSLKVIGVLNKDDYLEWIYKILYARYKIIDWWRGCYNNQCQQNYFAIHRSSILRSYKYFYKANHNKIKLRQCIYKLINTKSCKKFNMERTLDKVFVFKKVSNANYKLCNNIDSSASDIKIFTSYSMTELKQYIRKHLNIKYSNVSSGSYSLINCLLKSKNIAIIFLKIKI